MNSDNVILNKSLEFSVRVVRLHKYLCTEAHEYTMSKQLLRSGTSIGANVNEAQYAISKNDFLNKMHISLKECAETLYWIELLFRTEYISEKQYQSIVLDCKELHSLLSSITKSTRESIEK